MKSGSLANSFSFDLVFSGGSIIISSTLSDRSAASIFFTALSRALFQLVDLALIVFSPSLVAIRSRASVVEMS